jgi:hypothetical protein
VRVSRTVLRGAGVRFPGLLTTYPPGNAAIAKAVQRHIRTAGDLGMFRGRSNPIVLSWRIGLVGPIRPALAGVRGISDSGYFVWKM